MQRNERDLICCKQVCRLPLDGGAAFHPRDGRMAVFGGQEVQILDPELNMIKRLCFPYRVRETDFSGSGKFLCVTTDREVWLVDAGSLETLQNIRVPDGAEALAAVSPDDSLLAVFGKTNGKGLLIDTGSGGTVSARSYWAFSGWLFGLAFSGSGKSLFAVRVYSDSDYTIQLGVEYTVWGIRTEGMEVPSLDFQGAYGFRYSRHYEPEGVFQAAPAADSLYCLYTDRRMRTVCRADRETGKIDETYGKETDFDRITVTPDGKLLAAADHGGETLSFWKLPEMALIRREPVSCGPVREVRISPDAGRIALKGGDGLFLCSLQRELLFPERG